MKLTLKNPAAAAAGFRTLARLRGTTIAKELKRNAGIITEYCAKMLPPTTGKAQNKGAISQSWNTQKRGEKAIKRDIAKLFKPLRSLDLLKNIQWAAAVNRMIRRRDTHAIEEFLQSKGVHADVIVEATTEIHQRHRNARGRVKKSQPYLVIKAASIKRVLNVALNHVGRAKAGYVPALRHLGRADPPDWVTRHSTPGHVMDKTWNPLRPSVRVENLIGYGYSYAHLQIPQKAIEIREKTAAKEIRETLRGELRKGMRQTKLGK